MAEAAMQDANLLIRTGYECLAQSIEGSTS